MYCNKSDKVCTFARFRQLYARTDNSNSSIKTFSKCSPVSSCGGSSISNACVIGVSVIFKIPNVFSNISAEELKASAGVILPFVQISNIKLSNSDAELLLDVSTKKFTLLRA